MYVKCVHKFGSHFEHLVQQMSMRSVNVFAAFHNLISFIHKVRTLAAKLSDTSVLHTCYLGHQDRFIKRSLGAH